MEWFRHYNGLCMDKKLHKIARAAKVRRYAVIAAWCAILEDASQSSPRGDVGDIDPSTLAYTIDAPEDICRRILAAIREAGMIVNGRVAAWDKRQKVSDDSAIRQQQRRTRQKKGNGSLDENQLELNETTPRMSRDSHATNPSRTEQNRLDKKESIKPPLYISPPLPAADATGDTHQQSSFLPDLPKPKPKPSRFGEFWAVSARKVGKVAAEREYGLVIRSGKADEETLISKNLAHTQWCERNHVEAQYRKHPRTWLHQGCWQDELVDTAKNIARFNGNACQKDPETGLRVVGRKTKMFMDIAERRGLDLGCLMGIGK